MSHSSARSVAPLLLEPGPSPRVRLAVSIAMLLALLAVLLLPLPIILLLPCMLLLLALFATAWRRHHALNGNRVAARLDSDGHWYWLEHGTEQKVELQGDSYLTPFLLLLNFKEEGKYSPVYTLLLTIDNIDQDLFRRARVVLRYL